MNIFDRLRRQKTETLIGGTEAEDPINYCPYCGHDLIGYRVGDYTDDNDDMYKEAVKLIIKSGKVSTSLIQHKLRVGYARASRMLDRMEEKGIIGPAQDGSPQKIYIKNKTL